MESIRAGTVNMSVGIRCGLLAIVVVFVTILPANAENSAFSDLLAQAQAQAAAGRRWAPPGDNMTETVMRMMDLISTATPADIAALSDLLETDKSSQTRSASNSDRLTEGQRTQLEPTQAAGEKAPALAIAAPVLSTGLQERSGSGGTNQVAPGRTKPGQQTTAFATAVPTGATGLPSRPGSAGSGQLTPSQIAPSQATPSQLAPNQIAPSQIVPSQIVPSRIVPSQIVPSQIAPSQNAPSQNAPSQAMPSQATPNQLTPSQIAPSQIATFEGGPRPGTPSLEPPSQIAHGQLAPDLGAPSRGMTRQIVPGPIVRDLGTLSRATPSQDLAEPDSRAAMLFARGLDAELRGDLSAARRFYTSSAQFGDAAAARNLGRLYDPAYIKRTALGGIDPNPDLARHWYERALTLGDAEAGPLLQALSVR
jgi:hypothetical protein